jgi:GntR family transcriptional repressor for pyruvate dehydrogenase complex
MLLESMLPRPNLAVDAASQLARSISDGSLAPGARLPSEIELARRLGVSRPVIREAIAYLKADGIVETRRGLGLFVRSPETLRLRVDEIEASEKTIREFLEFRRGLEVEAVQLAALRHGPEHLARMEEALASLNASDETGRESAQHDLAFHLAIADAAQNPLFRRVLQFVSAPLLTSIRNMRARERGAQGRIDARRADHARILDRIRARDAAGAGEAMRRHIDEAYGFYAAPEPAAPTTPGRTRSKTTTTRT